MHSAMQTYSGSGPEPVANSNRRSECFQPRSDNIEIPTFLRQNSPVVSLESEEGVKGVVYTQLSQTDSESSSLKNRSDFSLGSVGLNHNLNNNGNNSNSNDVFSDNTSHPPPPRRRTTSPGSLAKPSLAPHNKINLRLRSESSMPFVRRYMPVKTLDGPNSPAVMQKSASLPRSYSSDELAAETAVVEGKLQRQRSSSMELLDSESSTTAVYKYNHNNSRTTGKPPLSGKQRVPLRHRYSSPILDISNTSQKSDDSFWFEYGCV